MPSCAGFLKPRNLDRRNLHSVLRISYAACLCLHLLISTQFAIELYLAVRNCQTNPLKTPILAFKVISANREPVYNFLLMINSNLDLISHRYWDTATYWLKNANFFHSLSFSALVRGDLFRIYGKALRILKQEFSKQPTVKIWWS